MFKSKILHSSPNFPKHIVFLLKKGVFFERTEKMQKAYLEHLENIKNLGKTTKESVEQSFTENEKEIFKKFGWVIVKNIFPYDLPDKYQHKIIWTETDQIPFENISAVCNCLIFVNFSNHQSVKDFQHYHLILYAK